MDLRKRLEGIARMLRPTAPGEFLRSERRMKAAVRLTSLSVVLVLFVSVFAYRVLADDDDQDVASAGLDRTPPSDLPSPGVDALTTTSAPPTTPPSQSPSGSTTTSPPDGRPDDPPGRPPTTLPPPPSSTTSPSSTATTAPGGSSTTTTEPQVGEFDVRIVTPPTHDEQGGPDPRLIGSFDGDRDLDGGCTWLVQPNGVERSVRWPAGTTIRFFRTLAEPDTFEVLDADGAVVLRRGEAVEFGIDNPVDTPLDRCQVGTEPALSLRAGSFRAPSTPPS